MHCLSRNPRSCLVNSYSDFKEKNEQRREGYEATWLDVVMETRPEQNMNLLENNSLRRETYEQKQWAHFVVRRHPDQTLRIGRYGDKMRRYELPYRNVLPLPLFVPKNIALQNELNQKPIPAEDRSTVEFDKASLVGVCTYKKDPSQICRDMPPMIQPSRLDFRASRA
ncbi:telethonin [Clupea harengus]|uniref:Telethonin n=1 Tax=Clupea harengus TaxID=7950 RepID=A0A8M1KDF5_CLUHA|nr:telethonin [Clupea harengus]